MADSLPPERDPQSRLTPTLDPASVPVDMGAPHEPVAGAKPPSARQTSAPLEDRPAPQQVGPYKMLQVIGEGGFGTVWIADQTSPVKRRVALKIIKLGMDSRAVIARFEQERQALALMDHPNIAKVFDAGTSGDGRPFFVIEYVAGESVTAYCDRNRLNVRDRLQLFIPICEAVQHAHHKGIIHRDLKPGNVLVASAPGAGPLIKVIDFGVAKAVSHVLTDKTIFTEQGQILGTPEYMSPEQAEMGALDIDTRTDVYSLGVMLYELLAGALPFEPHDMRSKGYNEIQRIIREVDPPRPSNRLRSLGAGASSDIAKRRQMKMEELAGQLRKELEWIPLKAMRKERDERYATPMAMADDIRNHLSGLPLTAGPVSVIYRAKKFVSRNRFGVSAAAMIAMAIVSGAILSTIGFVRAARNAEYAQKQFNRADAEAGRLRQVNQYNTSLLASAAPEAGDRKNVTVRELLDNAVAQLDGGAHEGRPRIEAALRATLASTYRSLSLWDSAERQWQKALELETSASGADSPEAASALAGLGQVQLDTGKLDAAAKSLQQALSIELATLSPTDRLVADTINSLGALADARGDFKASQDRYRQALSIYKQSDDPMRTADAMTNLATALYKLGDNKQAIDLANQALTIRRQKGKARSVDVWNSLFNLASMYEADDDLIAAEKTRREALALAGDLVDTENRMTVRSLNGLARTLWLRGGDSLSEAEAMQKRAVEIAAKIDGPQSASVALGTDLLGCIARDRGELDRAIELFRQALAMRTALTSASHPDSAAEMLQLSDSLTRAGKAAEAIPLAERALAIRQKVFPPGHAGIAAAESILGFALAGAGEFGKAEPMMLESFKTMQSGSMLGRRLPCDAAGRVIILYEKWGKVDEAKQWRDRRAGLSSPTSRPS
ncbi:hypothetical protein BH09PLA1_BH09PLA1_06390 [soil metagenome]